MRLVENHSAHFRQNTRIGRVLGLLFNRQIGKEQMMIDDDEVALAGPPMHLRDKALFPSATPLAQASLRARVQFVP